MPFLRHAPQLPPSADPADWRPKVVGNRPSSVVNPIIEPRWGGVRVLIRIDSGSAVVEDEEGVDCSVEFEELAAAVLAATRAQSAILDGYLTVEPTQNSKGVLLTGVEAPTGRQVVGQLLMGSRKNNRPEPRGELDPERPIAFVAVDMLSVDETPLLDVPLLERKRLLDATIEQNEVVRVTPFIRPPIASFMQTWRAVGFREIVLKSSNSHYVPGGRGNEWSAARMPSR
jgi:ATP-dependent DNA ligase